MAAELYRMSHLVYALRRTVVGFPNSSRLHTRTKSLMCKRGAGAEFSSLHRCTDAELQEAFPLKDLHSHVHPSHASPLTLGEFSASVHLLGHPIVSTVNLLFTIVLLRTARQT
jgi:hypothetical protein